MTPTNPIPAARRAIRFDLELCDGESGLCRAEMIPASEGDFILFTAHASELAALRDQLLQANAIAETMSQCASDWKEANAILRTQLSEAQKQREELAGDKERLNWLLHKFVYAENPGMNDKLYWGLSNHGRAAIDAARANTPKT